MIATMTTEQKGGQTATQDPEQEFAKALEERILRSREGFFDTADNWSERRDNEEVRQREQRGEREFDYLNIIPALVKRLSSIDPSKRERIERSIVGGVSYRITGIYLELSGYGHGHRPPLLADVAQDPQKYFNHN